MIIGFTITCAFFLLLPWGLKVVMKNLFGKDVSYCRFFLIYLAFSMILCGIINHFYPN